MAVSSVIRRWHSRYELSVREIARPTGLSRNIIANSCMLNAFENLRCGNALYVMYGGWQELSRLPLSELLKLSHSDFDRIIPLDGWERKFTVLISKHCKIEGFDPYWSTFTSSA